MYQNDTIVKHNGLKMTLNLFFFFETYSNLLNSNLKLHKVNYLSTDALKALAADLSNTTLQQGHNITSFSTFCFFNRKSTNDSPASGKTDSSSFLNPSKA